jgi:hypothetical protein
MEKSVQALLKEKIQRYHQLRAMLIKQGRPASEIAHVDQHIARIQEIMNQAGSRR